MSVGSIVKRERYRYFGKKNESTREKQTEGSTICDGNIHNSIFQQRDLKKRPGISNNAHRTTLQFTQRTNIQRTNSRLSQYDIKSKASVEVAFNICAQRDPT